MHIVVPRRLLHWAEDVRHDGKSGAELKEEGAAGSNSVSHDVMLLFVTMVIAATTVGLLC